MFKFLMLGIMLLVFNASFAAEDASKLPPADQAAIDKVLESSLSDATKQYTQYISALSKAQEKAVKELEKLKSDAMKRGNLPLANAIDAKEKEVKDGCLGDRITEVFHADLLGESTARKFIRASGISVKASNSVFGGAHPDLLWTDGPGGFYEFSTSLPKGRYFLYALLASGGSRPCRLYVNKQMIGTGLSIETGGYTLEFVKTDKIGPFELDGQANIRIEPVTLSPHIYGFMLSGRDNDQLNIADFKNNKK